MRIRMTKKYWLWVCLFLVLGWIFGLPLFFRVSGDLKVCRIYYSEMNVLECYFSSKTVRVPGK